MKASLVCIFFSPNGKIMPNLSRNGVVLTKLSSFVAPAAVILTATGAADDDIESKSRRRQPPRQRMGRLLRVSCITRANQ